MMIFVLWWIHFLEPQQQEAAKGSSELLAARRCTISLIQKKLILSSWKPLRRSRPVSRRVARAARVARGWPHELLFL